LIIELIIAHPIVSCGEIMKIIKMFFRKNFIQTHFFIKFVYIILFKNSDASINGINKKLGRYLNYLDGFFVELGANDGLSQSNTFFLEKKLGWTGILVDPSIQKLSLAKKIRHSSLVLNYFCSNKSKRKITLFDNDLETSVLNLNRSSRINTEVKTLTEILIKNNAPKTINFLSLDVEGHEYEVLEGLDLNLYLIQVLLIEIRSKKALDMISTFLSYRGYKCKEKITIHDYIFMKQ